MTRRTLVEDIPGILEARSESIPFSGCRIWLGALDTAGYGVLKVQGKLFGVHRLAYESMFGDVPMGMQVLHTCDVSCCINPDHLWIGTNLDNVWDRTSKNRSSSKLTLDDVRFIRASSLSNGHLSATFRVDRSQISRIKCGKRWEHV